MRHRKKTVKLGRSQAHRDALLANQVCSLIEHSRIKTTLAKAKAIRPLAEKMVTLGKKGSVHDRRTAFAVLRQKDAVKKLFGEIAPRNSERKGGYTRIVKLGLRKSDAAAIAIIEWVDTPIVDEPVVEAPAKAEVAAAEPAKAKKPRASKAKAAKTAPEEEEPQA